jgi:hypothetical protein
MEQLLTLSQTIMALNKKEQMIFRAKFALRKCMPDKKFVHRKYKLIQEYCGAKRSPDECNDIGILGKERLESKVLTFFHWCPLPMRSLLFLYNGSIQPDP